MCVYPQDIKDAQCLIAYNLVVNPELITGTPGGGGSAPSGTYVLSSSWARSDKICEYSNSDSASSNECADCSTPAIIAALPWLKGILGCWADISAGSSSKVLLRVRG